MTLNNYQKQAAVTATFDHDKGLIYTTLGLASEAGEVAGKVKRIIRDDGDELSESRREEIIDELGDVLWYLSQVANQIGADLDIVGDRNLRKLADRQSRGVIRGAGDRR